MIMEKESPSAISRDLLKFYLKIFQLLSNKNKYYIIAGGLLIGENKWTVQDRIINFSSNLEHDEVIFQSSKLIMKEIKK